MRPNSYYIKVLLLRPLVNKTGPLLRPPIFGPNTICYWDSFTE